jgi:hypothetical protein
MVEKYGRIGYNIGRFYPMFYQNSKYLKRYLTAEETLHAVVSEWRLYRDMEKTMGSTELF